MSTKEKETLNGQDQVSKLDAIKNIIFGENMAQYEQAFKEVKEDIEAKKEYLQNYIDDVRKELEQHIDSVSTDLNIRITDLETKLEDRVAHLDAKKVDKKTLSKLLISLGEKIGN
jgi:tRNA U34 5-carboxymethylaminomethyl modifying GTPase MnmE/TrmE